MDVNFVGPGNVQYVVRRSLVIAALGLVVAGCSGGDLSSDLIRAHDSSTGGGMDAIVQGIVEVDLEARCVWLSSPEGTRYPVLWPAGTTAHEDPFEVVLPDGARVHEGDVVTGGGGYVDAVGATQGMAPFPDACVQTGEAAVFNASSPIEVSAGVGLEEAETLVDRISVPTPVGLELIAINANLQSVGVVDLVAGTVHLHQQGQYAESRWSDRWCQRRGRFRPPVV